MLAESGRFVIVYNGEIYNFRELAKELAACGYSFRGHSDTEVILSAVEEWGLETALCRFDGMFAFALWDIKDETLSLARDRVGKKPLYYGWGRQGFCFASELKAIRAIDPTSFEIDESAFTLYTRYGCIPAPWSIYKNIYKLVPGAFVTLDRVALSTRPNDFAPVVGTEAGRSPKQYWSINEVVKTGLARPFRGTDTDAETRFIEILERAVQCRMISDVPLGAFLSGGIDSSLVVAIMQRHTSQPVQTFSIGFDQANYDEAPFARAVARHLRTDHNEVYVTPTHALEIIPRLPDIYDEPFADSSQIPTFLVSEIAKQKVTVSLSGDGGDELFGGYPRYAWADRISRALHPIPAAVKRALSIAIAAIAPERWDAFLARFGASTYRLGDKAAKLGRLMSSNHEQVIYRQLLSQWEQPGQALRIANEPPLWLNDERIWGWPSEYIRKLMLVDFLNYLPDDILVKVDRASMAVSLEVRAPLLDHHLIEFVLQLPFQYIIRNGQTKWLLKRVLQKHVPRTLTDRPKMGFGVPIDSWLRGPLRDWGENLLSEHRLNSEGYYNTKLIRKTWSEHIRGKANWDSRLWNVLMFQSWLERWKRS